MGSAQLASPHPLTSVRLGLIEAMRKQRKQSDLFLPEQELFFSAEQLSSTVSPCMRDCALVMWAAWGGVVIGWKGGLWR